MSSAETTTAAKGGISYWGILKQTFKDWSEDNAMRLAAAMACYIMLALAPMIVITFTIISNVPTLEAKTDKIVVEQVTQLVGAQSAPAIEQMVDKAQNSSEGTLATIISLLIVVVSASGVFISLQDALNTIWEVKPKPNAGWWQWFRKRFLSIGMVFGIGLLLLSSMAVTSVLHLMIDAVFGSDREGFAKVLAYGVDFLVTVGVAWALFMTVFKYLPDAKVSWSDVWVGALVTAILFKLGQIGMALYFNYGSATSAYGAFGSIVAVLLWAYYSSMILFLGAEFTQVWAKEHGRSIEPEAHAVKVTEDERAQQGIPSKEAVAATPAGGQVDVRPVGLRTAPSRRPVIITKPPADGRAAYGLGGAALGAVAAGLATWLIDQKLDTRKRVAQAKLDERIGTIESKLGRVARLKEYLERMEVSDRIDTVEREVQRAGRHVRAKETGRPLWMVRLADRIGGRWSNL